MLFKKKSEIHNIPQNTPVQISESFRGHFVFILSEVLGKLDNAEEILLSHPATTHNIYGEKIKTPSKILTKQIYRSFCKEKGLVNGINQMGFSNEVIDQESQIMEVLLKSDSQNFLDMVSLYSDHFFNILSEFKGKENLPESREKSNNARRITSFNFILFDEPIKKDSALELISIIENYFNQLNSKFEENRLPFSFEGGVLIKDNSRIVVKEIIEPTLTLTADKKYKSVNREIKKAMDFLHEREYASSIIESYKAVESTIKIICKKHNWEINKQKGGQKSLKPLLDILFEKGLLNFNEQSYFSGLRSVLESSVAMYRNIPGVAHGKGNSKDQIKHHQANFVFHNACSTIVFLIHCDNQFK